MSILPSSLRRLFLPFPSLLTSTAVASKLAMRLFPPPPPAPSSSPLSSSSDCTRLFFFFLSFFFIIFLFFFLIFSNIFICLARSFSNFSSLVSPFSSSSSCVMKSDAIVVLPYLDSSETAPPDNDENKSFLLVVSSLVDWALPFAPMANPRDLFPPFPPLPPPAAAPAKELATTPTPPNSSNSSSSYPAYPPARPSPNSICRFLFKFSNAFESDCMFTLINSGLFALESKPMAFLDSGSISRMELSARVKMVVDPDVKSDVAWDTLIPCKSADVY
mmetsp:Transcript_34479/g.70535  ORF Transcript_34479/g.70535 Transcript_34479/m.70535 type:complete len:275 (-) Transcript_34479:679-1503(-)